MQGRLGREFSNHSSSRGPLGDVAVILIALVFLIPIWRITSSKGYNGKAFVFAAGIPATIAQLIDVILEPYSSTMGLLIPVGTLGIPLLTLGLAAILPTRPGAPGKAWLKITFPCPHCGEPGSQPSRPRE